jgi:hypothetical protein
MKKLNNHEGLPASFFDKKLELTNTNSNAPIIKKKIITHIFKTSLTVTCSNGTDIVSHGANSFTMTQYDDD